MKNVKLTIEYDGTNFCGWQKQPNARTVQEEIEKALSKMLKKDVKIYGSGRTDARVHALGQVANFTAAFSIPVEKIPLALNGLLPQDIAIQAAEEVNLDFHSRYSAIGKKYMYKILNAPMRSSLLRNYAHWVAEPLNIEQMEKAAKCFLGTHDFKGFMASNSSVENTIRSIYDFSVCLEGNMIIIETRGNGFLYNMVRIMAGTLIEVGRNKIQIDELRDIIQSCNRDRAGATAPAQGLYLSEVYY